MRSGSTSHHPDWKALQLAELDPEILRRYWLGDLSPDELESVDAWFAAKPGRREWYEQLHRGLAAGQKIDLSANETVRRTSAVLHMVKPDPMGRRSKEQPFRQRIFKQQPLRWGVWSADIAFFLVTAATIVGWNAATSHLGWRAVHSTLTYATANGQRATITLPDGSSVELDVASRLEIPADYVTGHRTVRLTGEGIFTVLHHTGTPFTVLAGPAVVRVLGTSFVVRHYATDSTTRVAVRDGKVAIRSVVLTAAQEVMVGRTKVGQVQAADPAQFSFATGILILSGIPLSEAIPELDRWYDADIRLGDPSLATRHMAGEFASGSIAELADYFDGAINVRVVRNGRSLTLFPR